jgi:hypothetical protein
MLVFLPLVCLAALVFGEPCSRMAVQNGRTTVAYPKGCPADDLQPVCDARVLSELALDGQHIHSLPACLAQAKSSLTRALFFNCEFETIPSMLGTFHALRMLSFKGNHLTAIPAHSIAPSLRWLILSANQLACAAELIFRMFYCVV